MGAGSHSETVTLGGRSMTRAVSTSGDSDTLLGGTAAPITLTAGKAVTSWVNSGSVTCDLPAGHGYGSSATVDVYWTASSVLHCKYGVSASISTNAATLTGGTMAVTGDSYPASADATVVLCKQQQVNVSIDGDLAVLVAVMIEDASGHIDFQDADSHSIRALSLADAEPDIWDDSKADNPYTGDPITKAMCSNGTTTDGTLQILVSQDSTP